MFFVRMIRLIPLVAIILFIGLIIYLVAQAKYSPNRAKQIVIKVFFWINIVLLAFFCLSCIYAILDKNEAVLDLFASFAAVPALGLIITLICRAVFLKHHPEYKNGAVKTSHNVSFKEFWKQKAIDFIKNKMGRR
ncbi:MAG: guanylate cyclase [Coriobacteriia bacterium]|nr:guanylate cyclase [Coriobacteriia bacterium]